MSGGVIPELGGMKMVENKKIENLIVICCLLLGIGFMAYGIYTANIEKPINYSSNFNKLMNNQQVLFNSQLALADNQKVIVNACGLQGMIQEGCVISNRTNIDANTSAVTLLCPIKEAQVE